MALKSSLVSPVRKENICTTRTHAVDQPGPHQRPIKPERLQYNRFSRRTGNNIANLLSFRRIQCGCYSKETQASDCFVQSDCNCDEYLAKSVFVCVAGPEHIANMTPRDQSSVPCETRNQWRRKNDTARWFHTFFV